MNKTQLKSLLDTFIAMFLAAIVANIDQLDFENLSRGAILAFAITLLRDVIKRVGQYIIDKRTKSLDNNV